ncbi:hypothetical protein ACFL0P_00830 [Candidatus Omnitrophota bacterium]
MIVLGHVAISLTGASIIYSYTHSLAGFLGFLITGIFVDLDHYIDYIRERGLSFNLIKICSTFRREYMSFKRLTVFLHSYELLALLWTAIFIFNLNIVWKSAAISFTLHLFIDQISNPVAPLAYFLWFRIMNNFETKKFL